MTADWASCPDCKRRGCSYCHGSGLVTVAKLERDGRPIPASHQDQEGDR